MEFELERPPTVDDLLTVIINREDVEALIGRPVSQLVQASKLKSQDTNPRLTKMSVYVMLVVQALSSGMFVRCNFSAYLYMISLISILSEYTQNSH